ncbi:Ferrochelatase, protoheme ferro-lyase [hydrothermal vent metagenome]|uniref:Ferrochelatase, protoheme ferro-lyase n=1 Tax=hydrothermal vent metagenome TaxID=652676 RepID=A0A3B1AZW8_9ZZZZ
MHKFRGTPDYDHKQTDRTGILIVNLGTPDAADAKSIRRYLAEFLSDPRVIEMPRWLWKLILHSVILRFRPAHIAPAYRSIWGKDGSPLLSISRQQVKELNTQISAKFKHPIKIALGMRYGNPSIAHALRELQAANVQRLLVLPLYPQYSATTTASTFDAVAQELMRWRWIPSLRMLNQYHDHPAYIETLAQSVTTFWQTQSQAELLLISFHGLPKRYLLAGDPYHCHCQKTARLLAEKLGLNENQWQISFQSRVGREEWLKPYTDETLKALPAKGTKSVQVICPGFPTDCLETLEEINVQNRDGFIEAGGEQFDYIPALNDSAEHIRMLAEIIEEQCCDWVGIVTRDEGRGPE